MLHEASLLLLHGVATLLMIGIIWFVQIVHYPLMAAIGPPQFIRYCELHQSRTSLVVGGPMLVEAFTAALLAVRFPALLQSWQFVVSLLLLAVIWISTATLQMPLHKRLLAGFDERLVQLLVQTNWLRTVAWTLRGGLVMWLWLTNAASS